MSRFALRSGLLAAGLLASSSLLAGEGEIHRFRVEPPVWKVVDEPVTKEPAAISVNLLGNNVRTLFTRRLDNALAIRGETPARDVNSLDELPDSAWFENRVGRRPLSAEQVYWGPCAPDGSLAPPPGDKLVIFSAKLIGANPGFLAQDSRKGRYVVKFDPPGLPELQTAADLVGGRLFWALGYHIPCDSIFSFRRQDISIKDGVQVNDRATGRKRPMTDADVDAILARAHRGEDGVYRVQLSRFVPGKPLGQTPQEGVRKDDPNDRIPHEERRSMRALRVFSAWVKHTDLKVDNHLDALVTEGDRSFVRHFLIDFGEIFAGQAGEQGDLRDGFEYNFDPREILTSLVTFGFLVKPWESVKDSGLRGIGPFGAEPFEFYKWKPLLPNRYMNRMNDLDAFWAVRKLMSLSPQHLEAAVRSGQYTDPAAAKYLLEVLQKRRETIAREVFQKVNPAGRFELAGGALSFRDEAVENGLADAAQTSWRVQLVRLGAGDSQQREAPSVLKEPSVALPEVPGGEEQLVVRIQTLRAGRPLGDPVHVHLVSVGGVPRILAIDRWQTGDL